MSNDFGMMVLEKLIAWTHRLDLRCPPGEIDASEVGECPFCGYTIQRSDVDDQNPSGGVDSEIEVHVIPVTPERTWWVSRAMSKHVGVCKMQRLFKEKHS